MPVFVEWKWKKRTKTFLVVFHFHDDFSSPNLRIKRYDQGHLIMLTESEILLPKKSWMTWSPSHPELALLTELLTYANMVNGLKESEKRELKRFLGGMYKLDGKIVYTRIPDKKTLLVAEEKPEPSAHSCMELCPEYIDYLRELLEPYIKD